MSCMMGLGCVMYDGMLFRGILFGEEWPELDVCSTCVLSKISQSLE